MVKWSSVTNHRELGRWMGFMTEVERNSRFVNRAVTQPPTAARPGFPSASPMQRFNDCNELLRIALLQRVQLFTRRLFPRAISSSRGRIGNACDGVAGSQRR